MPRTGLLPSSRGGSRTISTTGRSLSSTPHWADFSIAFRLRVVSTRPSSSCSADHGESLGDHGERTHGTFAYDSTLRVPWILWGKGLRPQVFAETVRQVDVMPTLLDLLAVPPPERIVGQSLRPYLTGELRYEAPASYFEALNAHLTQDWAPLTGVVQDGHKLIRLPIPELYDVAIDPKEKENLYHQKTGLVSRLQQTLDEISAESEVAAAAPADLETVAEASSARLSHGARSEPQGRVHQRPTIRRRSST